MNIFKKLKSRRMNTLRKSRKYGLIGYPLAHSLSPEIHDFIMKHLGVSGTYQSFPIASENFVLTIDKVFKRFDAFNVTIPYKERITPYLNKIDDSAKLFGAINTVYNKVGYNTDIEGFRLAKIPLRGRSVLIIGAGGVARIMLYEALFQKAKRIGIAARRAEQTRELISHFREQFPDAIMGPETTDPINKYDIVLNATPAGMWPDVGSLPASKKVFENASYVYDTIYNPVVTRMVLVAKNKGVRAENGLGMLIGQALAAQKIWNKMPDVDNINFQDLEAALKRKMIKEFPVKFVLTGFMGSGKTTVGKLLAEKLEIEFVDLDDEIIRYCDQSIKDIFAQHGENYFRIAETECLKKSMKRKCSLVMATGGGALTKEKNVEIVREGGGLIFYLECSLAESLKRTEFNDARPLMSGVEREKIEKLYLQRLDIYENAADYKVSQCNKVEDSIQIILNALGI